MAHKEKQKLAIIGYIFAVMATIFWSGNITLARGLNQVISPVILAFWRWLIAAIVILPFAIKPLMEQKKIIKRNITYLSIVSLLGVSMFNTLLYIASRTTPAINLSLISITFPIFVVILSRLFFNERITILKVMGILLVITGVLFLITKGNFSNIRNISFVVGDLWMLMATGVFAVYSILLKRKPKELNLWAFQASTFLLGILFLFPFYLLETSVALPIIVNSRIILSILYVGIFASLIAFYCWSKAIEILGPSKAGIVYYALPLFSGFWAFVFLNEKLTMIHFYSMVFIFSGILISNRQ